jgi:hypothetical protein
LSLRGKHNRSNLMNGDYKQTDCHVVPPRNDETNRSYF